MSRIDIDAAINAINELKAELAKAMADRDAAIKRRNSCARLVKDMCDDEDRCRTLLAAYDKSDSYCVEPIDVLIERSLAAAIAGVEKSG